MRHQGTLKGKKKCPKKRKDLKVMELMNRDGQITLESENLNKASAGLIPEVSVCKLTQKVACWLLGLCTGPKPNALKLS